MTKRELMKLLQAGKVEEFNKFRVDNPSCTLDFGEYFRVILEHGNLKGVNFTGANLDGACLRQASFNKQ